MLVIESKNMEGCRVLLSRLDVFTLQHIERAIQVNHTQRNINSIAGKGTV